MNFDPAIAAQQALARSLKSEDLREFQDKIAEAEDIFSSNAGLEGKHAFEQLQAIFPATLSPGSLPLSKCHFVLFLLISRERPVPIPHSPLLANIIDSENTPVLVGRGWKFHMEANQLHLKFLA